MINMDEIIQINVHKYIQFDVRDYHEFDHFEDFLRRYVNKNYRVYELDTRDIPEARGGYHGVISYGELSKEQLEYIANNEICY